MKRYRASDREEKVDGPASSEQPGERHDRERYGQHADAEIRRRDTAAASVLVLIEEAEARRQDEKGTSDHRTAHPPVFS